MVALMDELRRRVAEKKAAGFYTVDEMVRDRLSGDEPIAHEELIRLHDLAIQQLDLSVSPSNKPVLGRLVTKVKRVLVQGTSEPVIRMSTQTNEFNVTLVRYVALLAREIPRLQAEVEQLQAIELEEGSREVENRSAVTAQRQDEVDHTAVLDRLGRLEHLLAREGDVFRATGAPAAVEQADTRPMVDSPEDEVNGARSRWMSYASAFRAGPVLQLGSGAGHALEFLGPDAHGTDSDPDLVAAARSADRPVELADPVAHLTSIGDSVLQQVLVTSLVERLSAAELWRLLTELARTVARGGQVIIEGVYPAPLRPLADLGDAARHRPRHPDAVLMLLEGAGFASTRVEDFATRGTDRGVSPAADPMLQEVNHAIQEPSARVYGPSHYAVHAIR